jgi:acid stress chaperone HdeB
MKTLALASAILFGIVAAAANEIDLFAWTCKQLQAASKDDIGVIVAWLDGYYRAEDEPPIIDKDQLAANANKLGQYCATHQDMKLITAAGTLFERE